MPMVIILMDVIRFVLMPITCSEKFMVFPKKIFLCY